MKTLHWKSVLRHVYAFYGDASEFEQTDGASQVMTGFSGQVMWLESIEAERGRGNEAMKELRDFALMEGVRYIGLQVVPLGDVEESKLIRFYRRHGFAERRDLAPWSDCPVMVANLHRTFAGVVA